MLETAIILATKAHEGQMDKGGKPYILHPLAVMASVEGINAKIVAVLHDVVEDTGITLAILAEKGFSKEILEAVDLLTRRKGTPYFDYIRKIRDSKNILALQIKFADLKHNLDPRRAMNISDSQFIKYTDAKNVLLGRA